MNIITPKSECELSKAIDVETLPKHKIKINTKDRNIFFLEFLAIMFQKIYNLLAPKSNEVSITDKSVRLIIPVEKK
ncbi:hypothetical protein SDC9_128490 [bioreactor metagenome]|uniref:Uncharacterized protein n=1 Tax=bioreactor metagenome TaxID=1076179 RepID=A0A645CWZ6_9ZZZZ